MIEFEDTSREEDTLLNLDELKEERNEIQAKLNEYDEEDRRHEARIKELNSQASHMSLMYDLERVESKIFWVEHWKQGLELTEKINELLADTGFEIRDEDDYSGGFLEWANRGYTPVKCCHAENMLEAGQVKYDE